MTSSPLPPLSLEESRAALRGKLCPGPLERYRVYGRYHRGTLVALPGGVAIFAVIPYRMWADWNGSIGELVLEFLLLAGLGAFALAVGAMTPMRWHEIAFTPDALEISYGYAWWQTQRVVTPWAEVRKVWILQDPPTSHFPGTFDVAVETSHGNRAWDLKTEVQLLTRSQFLKLPLLSAIASRILAQPELAERTQPPVLEVERFDR